MVPIPEDDVDIRIRLRGNAKFNRDTRKSASEVDNLGDQAAQAARQLARLSSTSTATRVNLGPFSTSVRGGAIAIGGLILAAEKLTPTVLGAGEAVATVVGGAGAAGGVGLLALGQAAGTAKLGLTGLSDALGGNEEAMRSLTPEARDLFDLLTDARETLQGTAQEGLLPGLTTGGARAIRNLRVIDRIVGSTARTLGDLAAEGGGMLGSGVWGTDLARLGGANVEIIDNLGHGTLNLADASRHLLVEAAPLAVWLSEMAERGTQLTEAWIENKRQTGELARFFRDARRDLQLLGSATGHGGRGIINLFGAQDVDGTRTLENLDRMLARFERWSSSPAVRAGIGDAIVEEIPDAIAAAMDAIARNLPDAAGTAATVFWEAFWGASVEGKALMGAAVFGKLGGFKLLGRIAGRGGGGGGAAGLTGKGATPANPLFVFDVAGGGVPGKKGPGTISRAASVGRKALPFLGRAGAIGGLGAGFWGLAQATHMNDFPTGAPARRREAAGHAPFVHDPFQRVPDVQVTVPLNVDGQRLAQANARARARRLAREGF